MVFGGGGGGVWGPGGLAGGGLAGGQAGKHRGTFAGLPPELAAGMRPVLAREPQWPQPEVTFSHVPPPPSRLTFRRLLRPQARSLALLTVLIVIETVTLQAAPTLTQIGIDDGIVRHDLPVVLTAAVLAITAVLATTFAQRFRVSVSGRIAARAMFDTRVQVFTHLQRLSLGFYTEEKAGVILSRMTSDVEALQLLLQDGLAQFAVQGLTMVVVTVVLFSYNPLLAVISLLLILPALTGLSVWFRAASNRGYDRVRNGIAGVLGHLSESLQGVRVVTGFNRQRVNTLHHRGVVTEYRRANDFTANVAGIYGPSTELVGVVGQVVLIIIGASMIAKGTMTVGVVTAFVLYLNSFFQPIQQLTQVYNTYQSGRAALQKLGDLLNLRPDVPESPQAYDLPPVTGEIVLEHVSFGYGPDAPTVLHDINLLLRSGETVALVGHTGSGKSTIAKLVTRFYDPTGGRVRLDGHDLREVTITSLRRQLGVVPQEPFLFAGTVRDNVGFARPEATEEEIREAVDRVGLADVLARFPLGLDTPVHERGVSLSAGERQLIALARTFVARPRVVVLDEATSNLDLMSERKVEEGLDALLEGRTAIIVAHRLSTAVRADRIVVLDHGVVVEEGQHLDLVARGGHYAAMFEAWASGGEAMQEAPGRDSVPLG
jgi:ATP-binding cassette, subfamily B, bacterial